MWEIAEESGPRFDVRLLCCRTVGPRGEQDCGRHLRRRRPDAALVLVDHRRRREQRAGGECTICHPYLTANVPAYCAACISSTGSACAHASIRLRAVWGALVLTACCILGFGQHHEPILDHSGVMLGLASERPRLSACAPLCSCPSSWSWSAWATPCGSPTATCSSRCAPCCPCAEPSCTARRCCMPLYRVCSTQQHVNSGNRANARLGPMLALPLLIMVGSLQSLMPFHHTPECLFAAGMLLSESEPCSFSI